jgi:choline dehydrogenase-like flavoprotein
MRFYDIHQRGGATLAGKVQLTDQAQRDLEILNAVVRFEPRPGDAVTDAASAARRAAADLRRRRRPPISISGLLSHARAWPRLATLGFQLSRRQHRRVPSLTHGWAQLAQPSKHLEKFILEIQIELAPEPSNRITLSDQRDPLGQPLPAVTWRWGDLERRTVDETFRELNRNFERAGLGSVRLRDAEDIEMMTPAGDNHPTGTTRMHRDPAHGVVNKHGRVHGIENLYVTGSSVFPTSGYANPTLTIIAMAARLADHLARSS